MKIQKGIPIPPYIPKWGETTKIILAMKKGDSIVVDYQKAPRFRAAAHRLGTRLVGRQVAENKCRLWKAE